MVIAAAYSHTKVILRESDLLHFEDATKKENGYQWKREQNLKICTSSRGFDRTLSAKGRTL
jgi:hypothetical protein